MGKPVVGDDRVLVRVSAASVNAADWHRMRRLPHLIGMVLRSPRSSIRGFDVAGHVEAAGKDVTGFKPGDEVFGTGIGSFAEYVTTSEDRLAPKPRNLTFEQAAAIPVAGVTALHAEGISRRNGEGNEISKLLTGQCQVRVESTSPGPVRDRLVISAAVGRHGFSQLFVPGASIEKLRKRIAQAARHHEF